MVNAKKKGSRVELLLVRLLKSYGYVARRTQQFSGFSPTEPGTPDVICDGKLVNIHLECKGLNRIYTDSDLISWYSQVERDSLLSKKDWVIWFKQDNYDWKVIMSLDLFDFYFGENWQDKINWLMHRVIEVDGVTRCLRVVRAVDLLEVLK